MAGIVIIGFPLLLGAAVGPLIGLPLLATGTVTLLPLGIVHGASLVVGLAYSPDIETLPGVPPSTNTHQYGKRLGTHHAGDLFLLLWTILCHHTGLLAVVPTSKKVVTKDNQLIDYYRFSSSLSPNCRFVSS